MKLRSTAALAVLLLSPALAACGTTDPGSAEEAPKAAASSECEDDTTKTATGPVEMTDSFGRTVELDQPAERVAVIEWQMTEDLLTLCVPPVAVADIEGFHLWTSAEKVPEGTVEIGDRGEPNLNAVFKADPDLVVVEAYTAQDDILKKLAKYDVPVLATKGADVEDPIANMLDTFDLIAEATGRQERAEVVTQEFEEHLETAKKTVAEASPETDEFVFLDGWIQGGNVALRPFGQGSLVGEVGEELGLTNAYQGKVDPAYGLGQTDIEGMSRYGDATLFYSGTVDPSADAGDWYAQVAKNPIWKQLPAVDEGRAHAFPAGMWMFGGPRSTEQVVDAYVDVLSGAGAGADS